MGARLIGAIIGGVVAGAIGAAIWAGIVYGTGYEIGWIAWGIGGLVGFGVAAGGKIGGPVAGGLAVLIAVVSILGGKYASIELMLNKEMGDPKSFMDSALEPMDDQTVVSYIADGVVEERLDAGDTVAWPDGSDPDEAIEEADYPADVWADATARWGAMSPADQKAYRDDLQQSIETGFQAAFAEMRGQIARDGFMKSFGLMDILFFGLAIVTAFKIAASGSVAEIEV